MTLCIMGDNSHNLWMAHLSCYECKSHDKCVTPENPAITNSQGMFHMQFQ